MRQVEHRVEVGIDKLAASGELRERGVFVSVAPVALEPGDPAPNRVRTIGGASFRNLSVESR